MSNTKTEAQRLADQLTKWANDYATTDDTDSMARQAAAELRRLDAENQLREIENAVKYAEEALATTEPEPTGIPELPEPVANVSASSPVGGIGFVKPDKSYFTEDQMRAYGEQCWKAGYKHGAWGDKPAVNQQLTTEPVDEREAFTNDTKDAKRYRWLRDDTDSDWAICEWSHDPGDEGYYRDARAPHIVDAAIDAAMAQGVKG